MASGVKCTINRLALSAHRRVARADLLNAAVRCVASSRVNVLAKRHALGSAKAAWIEVIVVRDVALLARLKGAATSCAIEKANTNLASATCSRKGRQTSTPQVRKQAGLGRVHLIDHFLLHRQKFHVELQVTF